MTAPYHCVSLAQLNLAADARSEQTSSGTHSPGSNSIFTEWEPAHPGWLKGSKFAYENPPQSLNGASACESEEDVCRRHNAERGPHWMKERHPSQNNNSQVQKIGMSVRHVGVSSDLNVRNKRPKGLIPSSPTYQPFSDFLSSSTLTDNERHLLEELMPENVGDSLSIDTTRETGFGARRCICWGKHQSSSTWLRPEFEPDRRIRAPGKSWQFEADKHQAKLQGKLY